MDQIIELSPHGADPPIRCDRGVSFVPPGDRHLHAPDLCLLGVERGSLVARCSCWWRRSTARLGVIGHYAAADAESGAALLAHASDALATAGCTTAAGPMDAAPFTR